MFVHPSLLGLEPRRPKEEEPVQSIKEKIQEEETIDMLRRSREQQASDSSGWESRPRFFRV